MLESTEGALTPALTWVTDSVWARPWPIPKTDGQEVAQAGRSRPWC